MLTQDVIYTIAGSAMFCIGLYGLLAMAHTIRKILAINIMGIGVFMLLLATAGHGDITDPVPHAMVLTGIVVAVAGTALCLRLIVAISDTDKAEREDRRR